MNVPLIINPHAGRGRAGQYASQLEAILAAEGIETELHFSREPGHLEQQVREAARRGSDTLIVAGGDGSMHEAANGIVHAGSGARLGVIPIGTGNDFAKALGVSLDSAKAARDLGKRLKRDLPPRRVDVGECNGRVFANSTGIGIDARVAAFAKPVRLPVGSLVYVYGVIRCLLEGIATPSMRITIDGEEVWSAPATLTSISNGSWVGGRFHIAPGANPADGKLDVIVAAAVTRSRILKLLPALLKGTHMDAPEVSRFPAREIKIRCDEPVVAHLDGELVPATTDFRIRILPGALRVA